ncbi:polysaccharide biosynthesis protein [Clostridium ihumii]|uniref:polysaccharide biosynthesis protein n=1 Tax=Clostridium ihumii TaxID=1470356 RepID=UPI000590F8F4|nr:nucleoside-diphosphate sugar epimerase/dehydratase [Clostridium ihumii]
MKNDKKIIIFDVIFIMLSLYMALLLKFDFKIPNEYEVFFASSIIPLVIFTIFFNKIFKLYDNIWKYASIDELFSIVYSVSLTNIVFVIYSYFVSYTVLKGQYYRFPMAVHIIFWVLSVLSLGGLRFLLRVLGNKDKSKEKCENKINTLLVGAGDAGALIIKEVRKHPDLSYNIVGIIDDNEDKTGKRINGIKVLGGRDSILNICKEEDVKEIILAMPSVELHDKKEILNICKETKCKLKTVPGVYEFIDNNFSMGQLRDVNIEDLLGREPIKLDSKNIDKYIKNRVVLVTGGGGSIGSELCRQIVKFNPSLLIILDIYENNAYDLEMELNRNHPEQNKKVIIASIRDVVRLKEIFTQYKPEVVFHAAAHKHVPLMEANPNEAIKNNIIGTYNLAKCCDEFNVKKFVQISTDKAVNPTNVMGATKRFCELIIQAFDKVSKTEFVAVRFGNVLGSNGSVIPLFKDQIASGGPITLTHPDITRFFMTIPEAAQLVIQAGGMAKGGEIFVLDMGKPVKIADLARDLISLSGLQPDVDIKIECIGLRPGEKLYEELLMDEIALTSTGHKKIFVEKPMEIDIKFIEQSIEEFKKVQNREKEDVVSLLSQKVPTYKRKDI